MVSGVNKCFRYLVYVYAMSFNVGKARNGRGGAAGVVDIEEGHCTRCCSLHTEL